METLPFPQAEKIARHGESSLSHQTRFRWALMGALFGGGGGISLLHLSWGYPRRALPVIPALWSPDFPHLEPFGFHPRLSNLRCGNILTQTGTIVKSPLQILFAQAILDKITMRYDCMCISV